MVCCELVRSVGRYQWFLISVVMFSASLLWNDLGILVMAPTVPFRCLDNNVTSNFTSQCYFNDTNNFEKERSDFAVSYERKCEHFAFDHSMFQYTLTERFQLICDRDYLIPMIKSVFIFGYMIGSLLAGMIADRFGRKSAVLLITFFGFALNVASAFVPNFWAYLTMRVFIAMTENGTWMCIYILATENLHKDQRIVCKVLDTSATDVSEVLLGAVALVMSNYRNQNLINAAFSGVLFLVFLLFVYESPQWTHTNQGEEKAREIVDKISKINGTESEQLEHLLHQTVDRTERGRIWDVFKYPLIRKRTFILAYISSAFHMTWYAITYNLGDFSADLRISMIISGAVDIPLAFISGLLIKRFGRTVILFSLLLGAGLCCLGMVPLVEDPTNPLLTALAIIGKELCSQLWLVMYLLTPELYPTVIRVMGVGVCSTISRPFSALAPQIVLLNRFWPPLMVVVLGSLSIIGAFLVPLLPDTTNVELPQTIEDGENLFKNHGYSLRKARPSEYSEVHSDTEEDTTESSEPEEDNPSIQVGDEARRRIT